MALLTVENLSLGYEGHAVAEALNFSLEAGAYLCVIGENGSGKTTLMRTLLGLQPPLGGRIRMGEGLKQSEIGYLPQQTAAQKDFPASVREIVRSGCLGRMGQRPFYSREEKRLAEENMARMGISNLADRCYRELSGGQQQRVLLARALCAAGKLLLLDEPVSGLDPEAAEGMYQLIHRLNTEGVTILMISHDRAAAMSYASHILRMGPAPFFGTREAFMQAEGKEGERHVG